MSRTCVSSRVCKLVKKKKGSSKFVTAKFIAEYQRTKDYRNKKSVVNLGEAKGAQR